jgi:hypothetical protein
MLVYALLLIEDGFFNMAVAQKSPRDRQRMYEAREKLKELGLVGDDPEQGWVITQNGQIKCAEIKNML